MKKLKNSDYIIMHESAPEQSESELSSAIREFEMRHLSENEKKLIEKVKEKI